MTVTSLPWMMHTNTFAWNNQQQVYNRTVDVHRQETVAGPTGNDIGDVGYSGAEQSLASAAGEIVLYTALRASVQVGAVGRTQKGGLPGDAVTKPVWTIFIPVTDSTLYQIRDRDIIIDDEGYRYEVGANQWTGLGYQLSTVRLEA